MYVYLYAKLATSFWGTTSCTVYPLHTTSVALTPLSQVNTKKRVTNFHGKLYSIRLTQVSQGLAIPTCMLVRGGAGSVINMLQSWQSDLNLGHSRREGKVRNKQKKEREKWQRLREGVEPTTWQMACHVPANWAVKSFTNSVTEFEYLRLSCQGSSQSRYCSHLACLMRRVRRVQSTKHRLSYKHASDLIVRDRALYIYLHFYIIPTSFAYFLACHPYILLHF